MKKLPKAIFDLKDDPRVDTIEDERDDNNGYWVYLKRGLINDADGIHMVHEMTVKDVMEKMKASNIVPCQCGSCLG